MKKDSEVSAPISDATVVQTGSVVEGMARAMAISDDRDWDAMHDVEYSVRWSIRAVRQHWRNLASEALRHLSTTHRLVPLECTGEMHDDVLREWAEHRADDAGRLARELLALRSQTGWRDIASAPEDGNWIYVSDGIEVWWIAAHKDGSHKQPGKRCKFWMPKKIPPPPPPSPATPATTRRE